MNTVYERRVFLRERVAPRASARFVDRVHETIDIEGLTCRAINVPIYHEKIKNTGREDSLLRNVRLLEMMLNESSADHPRRGRWEYYLGCDSRTMGRTDEALEHFRIRAGMDVFQEEQALAAINVAEILFNLGRYDEAIAAGKKTIQIKNSWRDPYYTLGQCYYALQDYEQAAIWFELCLKVPRPRGVLPISEALYGGLPFVWLAKCSEHTGAFKDAEDWVKKALRFTPPVQAPEMNAWVRTLQAAQKRAK